MSIKETEKILQQLEKDTVKERKLSAEMKQSFLDYSMSVIKSRAIPDYRDGLKPVHRRIIYAAYQEKLRYEEKYKKSAAIVGSVMASYHPHGDAAIYDALVRMAQDFSLRYPLIKGQGNFGSIDGDSPAAMRYTEAKLSKLSSEFLQGIDESWVEMVDNYDQSKQEPVVLPTLIPNALVNGAEGIAVGLATKIPPHNLSEVIDAALALLDNPNIEPMELLNYIQGPDFPTGGKVLNYKGVERYFAKDDGNKNFEGFKITGNYVVEKQLGKGDLIIINEIPYGVKKSAIVKEIAVRIYDDKKNHKYVADLGEHIVEVRDESNKEGIRIVVECEEGSRPHMVWNNLCKYTRLQINYSVNLTVLVNNEPKRLSVLEVLDLYLAYQRDMLRKRLAYRIEQLAKRIHILEGRLRIVDDIIEAVRIITTSETPDEDLTKRYSLSPEQLKDILDLPIGRLKRLSIGKMQQELDEKSAEKADKEDILQKDERQKEEIRKSLEQLKKEYGDERRTIIDKDHDGTYTAEDLKNFVPTVFAYTKDSYLNSVALSEISLTRLSTKRKETPTSLYHGDQVKSIISCDGRDDVLLFAEVSEGKFKVFKRKAYNLSLGDGRAKKGKPLSFFVKDIKKKYGDVFMLPITIEDYKDPDLYLSFVTEKAKVKRIHISEFVKVNSNGKVVAKIPASHEDKLKFVMKTKASHIKEVNEYHAKKDPASSPAEAKKRKTKRRNTLMKWSDSPDFAWIFIVSNAGRALKFPVAKVRALSRTSVGNLGMKLEGAEILSASTSHQGSLVFSITKHGKGKVTPISFFRPYSKGNSKGQKVFKSSIASSTWQRAKFLKMVGDVVTKEKLASFHKKIQDPKVAEKVMNTIGKRIRESKKSEDISSFISQLDGDKGFISKTNEFLSKLEGTYVAPKEEEVKPQKGKKAKADAKGKGKKAKVVEVIKKDMNVKISPKLVGVLGKQINRQVVREYLDKLDEQAKQDLEAFGKKITEENLKQHKNKITDGLYKEAYNLLKKLTLSVVNDTGDLAVCSLVNPDDEIILITNKNRFKRFRAKEVKELKPTAVGIQIFDLDQGDKFDYEELVKLSTTREVGGKKITIEGAIVRKQFNEHIVAFSKNTYTPSSEDLIMDSIEGAGVGESTETTQN